LYGFEPAETPIVESEEFVNGNNTNDEAVSDIFKLKDKGERNLALRYEFTFQLKRIANNQKLPYKRYQIGEVFRDEPTSSNRFRQFTQCDADIIGSTIKDEAEILSLISNTLKELEIKAVINVNNRKLLNEIFEEEGIKNKEQVMKEIDKLDKLPETEIKSNLKKYKAEKLLNLFKKDESYFKKYTAYSEIEELKKYCNIYKVKFNFQPSLARGLSYYNSTVFEIKGDMKETISAGGSYLINNIQSTGFSFGLDRISQLAKVKSENRSVLIISLSQDREAIFLAEELRKNLIQTTIMYGKPSKALEYANSYNLSYVIFVGEDEVKKNKFKLKNMISGKEEMLKKEEIIKKLL
jgi:histidyl-tRNA synthetase